jgi:hypothetical protein
MHIDLWQRERESAEVHPCGLRVQRDDRHRPVARIWLPKAQNPTKNFSFRSTEARDKFIAEAIANFEQSLAAKEAFKEEQRAAQAAGDLTLCDPGAIFVYSWGYDQTNTEFWQVVKRSGALLTLSPICCETVPGSEVSHGMADQVRPLKDSFIERCRSCRCSRSASQHYETCGAFTHAFEPEVEKIKKRVTFYGGSPRLSFDHGCGSLVQVLTFENAPPLAVSSHYRSWYH